MSATAQRWMAVNETARAAAPCNIPSAEAVTLPCASPELRRLLNAFWRGACDGTLVIETRAEPKGWSLAAPTASNARLVAAYAAKRCS